MRPAVILVVAVALACGSCRRSGGDGPLPRPIADPWTFACGTLSCDGRTTYCEVIKTDAPELPSDYACRPLPDTCRPDAFAKRTVDDSEKGSARRAEDASGRPTCDCFPPETRCDYCVRLDQGEGFGFLRMCVGGA